MKKNLTKSIFNKAIFWIFIGFFIGLLIIIVPLGIYTFFVPEMRVKYIKGDMLDGIEINTQEKESIYNDLQYEYTIPQTHREYEPQYRDYEYTPQSK